MEGCTVRLHETGLTGIGEEAHRLIAVNENDVLDTGEYRDGAIDYIGHERNRLAPSATEHPTVECRCQKLGSGSCRYPVGIADPLLSLEYGAAGRGGGAGAAAGRAGAGGGRRG